MITLIAAIIILQPVGTIEIVPTIDSDLVPFTVKLAPPWSLADHVEFAGSPSKVKDLWVRTPDSSSGLIVRYSSKDKTTFENLESTVPVMKRTLAEYRRKGILGKSFLLDKTESDGRRMVIYLVDYQAWIDEPIVRKAVGTVLIFDKSGVTFGNATLNSSDFLKQFEEFTKIVKSVQPR